jgi:F0F1-type ATP synthase membrane subunit b/b'
MDKTLHDLGGIVLNSLPTFVLVLILAYFVKRIYLGPLEKVLAERFRLTEGARKAAEESLQSVGASIARYEEDLSRARAEIYREQAEFLKKVQAEQAEMLHAVRVESEQLVSAIKLSLAWESSVARESLAEKSETLAAQIVDAILRPRAA